MSYAVDQPCPEPTVRAQPTAAGPLIPDWRLAAAGDSAAEAVLRAASAAQEESSATLSALVPFSTWPTARGVRRFEQGDREGLPHPIGAPLLDTGNGTVLRQIRDIVSISEPIDAPSCLGVYLNRLLLEEEPSHGAARAFREAA